MLDNTNKCFQLNYIRYNYLIEIQRNEELFHEIDIFLIIIDDWAINRFLFTNENFKKAYHALIKAHHWKIKFGVHYKTDEYFPSEIYQWGDPELFGQDKQNRYLLWSRIRRRNQPFVGEMINLMKDFFVHLLNKFDKIVHR